MPNKTPISLDIREGFRRGNEGKTRENTYLWMRGDFPRLIESRYRSRLKRNERKFIYFVARAHKRDSVLCASAEEILLSCKSGGHIRLSMFVKWRPLESVSAFSISALFYQTPRTDVHVCRMDAMTYRMRFSVTSEGNSCKNQTRRNVQRQRKSLLSRY